MVSTKLLVNLQEPDYILSFEVLLSKNCPDSVFASSHLESDPVDKGVLKQSDNNDC